jgi:hypothetical protein
MHLDMPIGRECRFAGIALVGDAIGIQRRLISEAHHMAIEVVQLRKIGSYEIDVVQRHFHWIAPRFEAFMDAITQPV